MMRRISRKNVGLIGLGIIGGRVAAGLRAAGYHVFVWNRTPKTAPNFLGSPKEVARLCQVIQIFVADAPALMHVLNAMEEVLGADHVIICNATVGPKATLEAAELVRKRGARFLDAPFTGSKGASEKRQLVYYVGGDEKTLQRVDAILRATSKEIIHCGEIGQAAVLKVVTNMIAAVQIQALAEALAIVHKSGLKPAALTTALEHNACRSGTIDLKLPKMIAGEYEPHFSLKHMHKDLRLGLQLAGDFSLEIPATATAAQIMEGAMNDGWAELDFASVFKLYESRLGLPGELSPSPAMTPQQAASAPEPSSGGLSSLPKRARLKKGLPLPKGEKGKDSATMEVVSSVPEGAKLTGTAESKTGNAASGEDQAETDPGQTSTRLDSARGLQRIKRFFSPGR